jgi:hypothetical protein
MANTYEIISKSVLGSNANYIEFTSIPSTYTDLILLGSSRTTKASINDESELKLNGTAITGIRLYGTGAGTGTDTVPSMLPDGANATSNTFDNFSIYIPNYASTTTYKSVSIDQVMENNATTAYAVLIAGLYSSNTAVSTIRLTAAVGNYVTNSSFYLYGIKNT